MAMNLNEQSKRFRDNNWISFYGLGSQYSHENNFNISFWKEINYNISGFIPQWDFFLVDNIGQEYPGNDGVTLNDIHKDLSDL